MEHVEHIRDIRAGGSETIGFFTRKVSRGQSRDPTLEHRARKRKIRLSRLTNDEISAKFSANPNPEKIRAWNDDQAVRLYGLPMSYPERHGPFISQRFQKAAFRLWVEEVEGMPAPGTVELVQGGKLFKEAGLLPARALAPEEHKNPKLFPDLHPDPPITITYADFWGDHAYIVTYGDSWGHGARHWMGEPGRSPKLPTVHS